MSYNSKYTGKEIEKILDSVEDKQNKLVSGINIKNVNGQSLLGSGNINIKVEGVIEETDPVFLASPAASITKKKKAEWDNKVDKVSGKQLSTEDFTSALKTKLEGLSNYDDTELSNALSTLRGDFDALVSGDSLWSENSEGHAFCDRDIQVDGNIFANGTVVTSSIGVQVPEGGYKTGDRGQILRADGNGNVTWDDIQSINNYYITEFTYYDYYNAASENGQLQISANDATGLIDSIERGSRILIPYGDSVRGYAIMLGENDSGEIWVKYCFTDYASRYKTPKTFTAKLDKYLKYRHRLDE